MSKLLIKQISASKYQKQALKPQIVSSFGISADAHDI